MVCTTQFGGEESLPLAAKKNRALRGRPCGPIMRKLLKLAER